MQRVSKNFKFLILKIILQWYTCSNINCFPVLHVTFLMYVCFLNSCRHFIFFYFFNIITNIFQVPL
jgi:hypothetical protein